MFRFFYICFLLLSFILQGQNDSISIKADQLKWGDIKPGFNLLSNIDETSSRFNNQIESPFTIYTITDEQIRLQGITSLMEALALLPGVEISEVGSSLDGSLFSLRGSNGNNYVKVLINNVNIKPFVTGGMPISEQIPITFVEKIEFLYGPAATLYGADASAGVINIITKKSTRPMSFFGSIKYGNDDYQHVNLKFDFNKGTSTRVFNFGMYANFSSRTDRNIFYNNNPELINYKRNPALSFVENFEVENNNIIFKNMPQQSQSVGGHLQYGHLKINFDLMARQDHSATGFSPYSLSYSNPQYLMGEKITSINAIYSSDSNKKFEYKFIANYLNYNYHPDANIAYLLPSIAQYALYNSETTLAQDVKKLEDTFIGGNNYFNASSNEGGFEVLGHNTFSDYIKLSAGINTRYGKGMPLILFNSFYLNDEPNLQPSFFEISSFFETYLRYKKFSAIFGLQFLHRIDFLKLDNKNNVYNPRIGIHYNPSQNHSLRANFSTSYRIPSPFFGYNSIFIDSQNPLELENYINNNFQPEKTYNYEVGYRFQKNKTRIELQIFHHLTQNIINHNFNIAMLDNYFIGLNGWNNYSFSQKQIFGLQSSITHQNSFLDLFNIQTTAHINYMFGNESFTISDIDLDTLDTELKKISISFLNFQPNWIIKLQNQINYKNWTILFNHQWLSKRKISLSESTNYLGDSTALPSYYHLDMRLNFQTTKNSLISLAVNNVFNTKFAGIRANDTQDALVYNPQPLRNWYIRATYFLD